MNRMFETRKSLHAAAVIAAGAFALLAGASPLSAADVTYERLLNPEPQNWLTNHHDFSAQRYSSLDVINRSNVKDLKLAFAIALGGTSKDEYLQMTPLVEDGFMYVVDSWGIVSKVDVRSGASASIVWQMNPKQEKQDRNRGVALWNNLVISQTGFAARVIATDKDTGKVVWETNLLDQPDLELTAAPLALKDQIVVGGSGGDRGIRPWVVALDARTGKLQWKTHSIPAPGEPAHL
jgi:alcohol dehydrogenase (cytochrome c)